MWYTYWLQPKLKPKNHKTKVRPVNHPLYSNWNSVVSHFTIAKRLSPQLWLLLYQFEDSGGLTYIPQGYKNTHCVFSNAKVTTLDKSNSMVRFINSRGVKSLFSVTLYLEGKIRNEQTTTTTRCVLVVKQILCFSSLYILIRPVSCRLELRWHSAPVFHSHASLPSTCDLPSFVRFWGDTFYSMLPRCYVLVIYATNCRGYLLHVVAGVHDWFS